MVEALAMLDHVRGLDRDLVFPGQRRHRSVFGYEPWRGFKRMGRCDVIVLGFRSTFRDWAAQRANISRKIAELCLAVFVGIAVERTNRRSDLFDKQRDLMERWTRFSSA